MSEAIRDVDHASSNAGEVSSPINTRRELEERVRLLSLSLCIQSESCLSTTKLTGDTDKFTCMRAGSANWLFGFADSRTYQGQLLMAIDISPNKPGLYRLTASHRAFQHSGDESFFQLGITQSKQNSQWCSSHCCQIRKGDSNAAPTDCDRAYSSRKVACAMKHIRSQYEMRVGKRDDCCVITCGRDPATDNL